MAQWKYCVYDFDVEDDDLEEQFTKLGNEGWELVGFPDGETAVFKQMYDSFEPFTGSGIRRARPPR